MWSFSPLALLPPVFSVLTAAGLWLVYYDAVSEEIAAPLGAPNAPNILKSPSHLPHRERNGSLYVPFISVVGNFPPASCFFSEVMNLAAFVGFIFAVLRYCQLRHRMDRQWLNLWSLVSFSAVCFGMTLVANFQLSSGRMGKMIHNTGTLLAFGVGTLFCWLQSCITLRANLHNEGRIAGIIRFLLSGSITICMLLYGSLKAQRFYMEAAQCQWALVMLFLIFFSTFAIEFRHDHFYIVCTDNTQPVRDSL